MNKKSVFLKIKDHSVSGEEFELIENSNYGFLETTPPPALDKLPQYYESEDYISHTDTKRNLFEKAYHFVRKISLKQKLKLINTFSSERKTLLDVGCGTGDFLEIALQNNWKVTGIEPNDQARAIANKKTRNAVFNLEQLATFKPQSFDVITLWHVLEHLPNLEEHIARFKTLLKPDGLLLIAVPNFQSYDAMHYKQFWAAYDVPRHLWHFNRSSMFRLMEQNQLRVIATKPMWFDAFYVSLLSEKYKTGTMNPLKGFWIGCCSNIKAIRSKEASSLIYLIKNL